MQQLWLFSEEEIGPKVDLTGLPHYPDPKDDNERLLEFQYRYKTDGDKKALGEIFRLGYTVAYKELNCQVAKSKQYKNLTPVDREMKAADAINYIIMALIKKPAWYITESFTAYIWLRVGHELKYARKVDKVVDFVDLDDFFKESDTNDYGQAYREQPVDEWN